MRVGGECRNLVEEFRLKEGEERIGNEKSD
jgi:hypothetical protein